MKKEKNGISIKYEKNTYDWECKWTIKLFCVELLRIIIGTFID